MGEDLRYITIDFPVPVELTDQDRRDLHEFASRICKRYEAAHPGRVMWVGEVGYPITSMPLTAQDDRDGVPMVFDEAGFQLGISEREDYRWECRHCGAEQGEHKHSILNGKAGDCDFAPACRVPRGIVCDGAWHRGWDGHDPYCQPCPVWSDALSPSEASAGKETISGGGS